MLLGRPGLTIEEALEASVADRHGEVEAPPLRVDVDRELARFGAWYELFPRSFGGFEGVAEVLPRLAELGFDVVYLPPIHPIGVTNRKGKNNALVAGPDDPGSPWAIGSALGGHDAIDPSLGTWADFDAMIDAAREASVEIAMDFAIQCSPDHPWLTEHPEWFYRRPDGTLKYAENPPKRYQDIYNVNFESENWRGLWQALRDIVLFWVGRGVRVFRVDNPHTKPIAFWEWLIADVRRKNHDVIFLAEAFTRPAKMTTLAKAGFAQSYTYFTWKNAKYELQEYVQQLLDWAPFYRSNAFVNTPDILHEYLQRGGPPAFHARLVLAATLSPSYGIYSGFESYENVPAAPGSEEYLDSEKYEVKRRTLDGALLPLISRLNAVRRSEPALQRVDNIRWLETENDQLIAYAKSDRVICVVNLDPYGAREGVCVVPVSLGLPPAFEVRDLLTDVQFVWRAGRNYVGPRAWRESRAGSDRMTEPGNWFERDPVWFKTAVFYEIHLRGFFDANDDGSGDFRGLTDKLDYLQWLGVDCIWLLPAYPSPLRDGGYDIADFFGVHPDYGTIEDFRNFVDQAHQRGLRVIADLVMNHTSSDHPWFQASRTDPTGPYGDWYVWGDDDSRWGEARVIFVDTEPSNWTWDAARGQYYWHRFFSHQPDLNYDNPEVQAQMLDVLRFWLDLGLDGFRLDAVPYLYERDGTNGENLPETHSFLKRVRAAIDANYADRVLLAEANQWPDDVVEYFGNGDGDECHMAFHFPVMPRMFMAVRREDALPIVEVLEHTPPIPGNAQWGLFLRNHDELTLEMVTDEERDYMYAEYAKDPRMKLNLGIRRRLAPLLDNGRDEIQLLHAMLFSLPGSPVLYYGDEIGMGDNIFLGDRDGVRTPMQWTGDRNAGFSRSDFAQLYLPPLMDPVYGFQAVNVEAQLRQPNSLLRWIHRLIALRKDHPVFGIGSYEALRPDNPRIFAHVRHHEDDTIICVHNLARSAQAVQLDLSRWEGMVPEEMLGRTRFPAIGELPYLLTLAPRGFFWFQLRKDES